MNNMVKVYRIVHKDTLKDVDIYILQPSDSGRIQFSNPIVGFRKIHDCFQVLNRMFTHAKQNNTYIETKNNIVKNLKDYVVKECYVKDNRDTAGKSTWTLKDFTTLDPQDIEWKIEQESVVNLGISYLRAYLIKHNTKHRYILKHLPLGEIDYELCKDSDYARIIRVFPSEHNFEKMKENPGIKQHLIGNIFIPQGIYQVGGPGAVRSSTSLSFSSPSYCLSLDKHSTQLLKLSLDGEYKDYDIMPLVSKLKQNKLL